MNEFYNTQQAGEFQPQEWGTVPFPQPTPTQRTVEQPAPQPAAERIKPYTLRRLKSKDVFTMFRIITKIGVAEFKDCFNSPAVKALIKSLESDEGVDISDVGIGFAFELAGIIIPNISKCEHEIYAFLSGLSEIPAPNIAEMDAVIFTEMIMDVLKKEEFGDFMRVVSGQLK